MLKTLVIATLLSTTVADAAIIRFQLEGVLPPDHEMAGLTLTATGNCPDLPYRVILRPPEWGVTFVNSWRRQCVFSAEISGFWDEVIYFGGAHCDTRNSLTCRINVCALAPPFVFCSDD